MIFTVLLPLLGLATLGKGIRINAKEISKNFDFISRDIAKLEHMVKALTNKTIYLDDKLRNKTDQFDNLTYKYIALQQQVDRLAKDQQQEHERNEELKRTVETNNARMLETKTNMLRQMNNNQYALLKRIETLQQENSFHKQVSRQMEERLTMEEIRNTKLSKQVHDLKRVIRNVNNNMSMSINQIHRGLTMHVYNKTIEDRAIYTSVHNIRSDIDAVKQQVLLLKIERYQQNKMLSTTSQPKQEEEARLLLAEPTEKPSQDVDDDEQIITEEEVDAELTTKPKENLKYEEGETVKTPTESDEGEEEKARGETTVYPVENDENKMKTMQPATATTTTRNPISTTTTTTVKSDSSSSTTKTIASPLSEQKHSTVPTTSTRSTAKTTSSFVVVKVPEQISTEQFSEEEKPITSSDEVGLEEDDQLAQTTEQSDTSLLLGDEEVKMGEALSQTTEHSENPLPSDSEVELLESEDEVVDGKPVVPPTSIVTDLPRNLLPELVRFPRRYPIESDDNDLMDQPENNFRSKKRIL